MKMFRKKSEICLKCLFCIAIDIWESVGYEMMQLKIYLEGRALDFTSWVKKVNIAVSLIGWTVEETIQLSWSLFLCNRDTYSLMRCDMHKRRPTDLHTPTVTRRPKVIPFPSLRPFSSAEHFHAWINRKWIHRGVPESCPVLSLPMDAYFRWAVIWCCTRTDSLLISSLSLPCRHCECLYGVWILYLFPSPYTVRSVLQCRTLLNIMCTGHDAAAMVWLVERRMTSVAYLHTETMAMPIMATQFEYVPSHKQTAEYRKIWAYRSNLSFYLV